MIKMLGLLQEIREKLILLGFLTLVAVGTVFVANAMGTLQILHVGNGVIAINVEELQFIKLSEEQKANAVEIAMGDSRVQEILNEADNYKISVHSVLEVQKIEDEEGKRFVIAHKEEFALVLIQIFKDYGQELGSKTYEVIVDLSEEKVTEIREYPEVRKLKPQIG
jgi:Flp pilus assembly secretin CpaC